MTPKLITPGSEIDPGFFQGAPTLLGQQEMIEKAIKKSNPDFEKVPFEQYYKDWCKLYGDAPEDMIHNIFNNIKLPERGTSDSAGYDFFIPFDLKLNCGNDITIPTGIRSRMPKGCFLALFPRSGQGFKYRLSIVNTVGIIDSDYYNTDNYGHIMIKIVYDGFDNTAKMSFDNDGKIITKENNNTHKEPFEVSAGTGFAQGIFMSYGITATEILDGVQNKKRTGGIGSTGM